MAAGQVSGFPCTSGVDLKDSCSCHPGPATERQEQKNDGSLHRPPPVGPLCHCAPSFAKSRAVTDFGAAPLSELANPSIRCLIESVDLLIQLVAGLPVRDRVSQSDVGSFSQTARRRNKRLSSSFRLMVGCFASSGSTLGFSGGLSAGFLVGL